MFSTSYSRTVYTRKLNLISKHQRKRQTHTLFCARQHCDFRCVFILSFLLIYSNCAHQTEDRREKTHTVESPSNRYRNLYGKKERSTHSVARARFLPVAVEYTRKTKTWLHGFGAQKAVAEKRNTRARAHAHTHIDPSTTGLVRSFSFAVVSLLACTLYTGSETQEIGRRASTAVAAHSPNSILAIKTNKAIVGVPSYNKVLPWYWWATQHSTT